MMRKSYHSFNIQNNEAKIGLSLQERPDLLNILLVIESCGMLLSAVHQENGEEKLHLLMVDPHIPAGAKLY